MKQQQDYIRDLSEIRSMMERTTKFLSLSGWAGIMAGVYALFGAYLVHEVFHFSGDAYADEDMTYPADLTSVILTAVTVLVLAVGTAVLLSKQRAEKRKEHLWNPTSKRLLINMGIPLVTGGLFVLVLISKGLIGLVPPMTLIFYGLSLFIASKFTYDDIKILGLSLIALGLLGSYLTEYGLLFWALGFGVGHVIYGIYMHFKYER